MPKSFEEVQRLLMERYDGGTPFTWVELPKGQHRMEVGSFRMIIKYAPEEARGYTCVKCWDEV